MVSNIVIYLFGDTGLLDILWQSFQNVLKVKSLCNTPEM